MQTASAFGSVQGSLSFFVTAYRDIAEWQAIVAAPRRLRDRGAVGARARNRERRQAGVRQRRGDRSAAPRLAASERHAAGHGRRVDPARGRPRAADGPSGSGKSTLFRAIAGIWPFGRGDIRIPAGERLMMLPQRPYFPVGSLAAAVAYPSADFDHAELRGVLTRHRPAGDGRAARRAWPLEPDAVARRAAAARPGAGPAAQARFPVPRRGHRLARRAGGGGAVPAARGADAADAIVSIGHRSTLAAFHHPPHRDRGQGRRQRASSRPQADAHAAKKGRQVSLPPMQKKGRQTVGLPPRSKSLEKTYLSMLSVASTESLATKRASHQLEPKPVGLTGLNRQPGRPGSRACSQ